jgi:hypothetical protein
VICSEHLYLFALLMNTGRVSIRDSNPKLKQWQALKEIGLCSILESGRRGTLVIHSTMKAHGMAESILDNLNPPHGDRG